MMAITQNNVYIHSSPPKAVSGQGAAIRQWVKNGDLEKLENVVLEGQGARLLGLMESTGDTKVKAFLRSIPGYMAKVDLIHDAVVRGSLRETQALIDKRKLATARDAVGRGVGHKAVLYNHKAVVEWLAKKYPETIQIKDNESRTPLHYTASLKDSEDMYDLLVNLGANTEIVDIHGRKAIYYVSHPEELDIEGPNTQNNRSFSRGKRRKISPISPKVAGMSPNITRAQIRIWIHERDISKLERIVWAGNGDKLLLETTNNAKIRKFLDNVPHLLSRIKSIHKAAIHNDVDTLKDLKRKTEVNEVFTAKDSHGLTAMHKAAGLGHRIAVEFFVLEAGSLINEPDNEGKTPLHYAAKDPTMYNFLKRSGADETIPDLKGRTPSYYRSHQTEFDTRYLRHIPDAPRVSGDIIGWDRGFSPQSLSQKRKISSGEFSGDGNAEVEKEEVEDDAPITMESILATATKVRRTSEEMAPEDMMENGKYDLSTNFDIRPEEDAGDGNAEPPPAEPSPVPPKSTPQTPKSSPVPPKSPAPTESSPIPPKSPAPPQSSPVPPTSPAPPKSPAPPQSSPVPPKSSPRPPSSPKPPKSSPRPPSSPKPPQSSPLPPDPSPVPPEEAEEAVEAEETVVEEKPEPPPETKKKSAYKSPYLNRPAPPPKEPEPEPEPEPEEDIEEYIKRGDMEKLVDRVLEGRGNELVGKESDNPEVQEFLLNVPAYMAKIASIHNAASSGNLRDLQSLLDRKRLALAQDEHGRGPLHKAVLHYHPAVVRYMASNYPQSLTLMDKNKRSALHYAATLPDSGVMYKTLIQTGADPNVKDRIGNTPGIYLRRKDLLTHAELLSANPAAAAPKSVKRNKSSVDTWERPPSTLQDKKVTSQQPALEIETTELSTLETYYHQISKEEGLWARTWRKLLLTSAQNSTTAKAYVKKYLTEEIFHEIKTRSTPRYGATLLDCIKFFPQYFLVAPDPHCYMTFKEVFIPAIRDHNGQSTVPIIHPAMVFQENEETLADSPGTDGDGEKSQFPAIWSEEGKYLASVLGDALVKGLTQVSQERPDDPVEYLANFLRGYRKGEAEMIVQNNVVDEKMEEDGAPDEEKMETEEEEKSDALAIAAAAIPVAAAAAAGAAAIHEIQQDEDKPEEEAASEEQAAPEETSPETEAAPEEEAMETAAAEEDAPPETEEAIPEENPEPKEEEEAPPEEETPAEESEAPAEEPEAPAEEPEAPAEEPEAPAEEPEAAAAEEPEAPGEEEVKEEETKVEEDTAATEAEGEGEEAQEEEADGDPQDDPLIQRLEDEVEPDDEDDEDAIHTVTGDEETDAAITTEHSGTRDDRGQSVLHFAAARPGGASTILAFLQNPSVNLAWRDEKLRTARDVAEGLNRTENVQTIDSWIVSLASSGEQETLEKLMMDGYTNILTVQDSSHAHIVEVAEKANHRSVALFLRSIPDFQEKLLKLHRVVRHGSLEQAKEILQTDGKLAAAMSPWGRCILHTAVLVEQHPIVQYVAQTFPECLRRGDSLERTALHYAMGIEKVEKMTRILVRAGAKRVVKDLRGRQPSYYFINREEIAQLQREEEQLKLANA